MSPRHSVRFCPICGGGLCGIRLCTGDSEADRNLLPPHGLIVCDECEAIWLEPDLASDHQYADAVDTRCPICCQPLWGEAGRWADMKDIGTLGWTAAVNRDLDRIDDPL